MKSPRIGWASAVLVLTVLAAGACTSTTETVEASEFCEQMRALDQVTTPAGGNLSEEFTEALAVAPQEIQDDVERIRDYHSAEYVEGDTRTDNYDSLPPDVRASVDSLDRFMAENCD